MNPKPITQNTLFYGDNLPILREYLSDESVDLIYLDPPFNSNRSYNVLFKDESGVEAESQIAAFGDTWHWNAAAEDTFCELVENGSDQKPLALLERIIQASSNEGDLVLDPFCGCGTAVAAAQKLNRRWIGIDITHLSITLMKYRLKDNFNLVEKQDYLVIGEPEDISDARQLAHDDRYQFQWWALSLIQAKPLGGDGGKEGKKGSDKGIDGALNFLDAKGKLQRVLIQVKSGHVNSGLIRDLRGTVEREGAAVGVFITLDEPTSDMTTEAVSAGYYQRGLKGNQQAGQLWEKDIPRIQILSIEDLFSGKGIEMPPSAYGTFKQAEKIKKKEATQLTLEDK